MYNHLPGLDNLAPEEKWTGSRFPNFNLLRRLHPWGCPAYVLDPALQDGKKLPKWTPRSRQGQYLGLSSEHASSVALILNPRTKRISPQFHLLFDDYFTTVQGVTTLTEPCLESFDWDSLFSRVGTERYSDGDGQLPTPPSDWPNLNDRPSHQPVEQPGPSQQPSPPPIQRVEPEFLPHEEASTGPPATNPLASPKSPLSEGESSPISLDHPNDL